MMTPPKPSCLPVAGLAAVPGVPLLLSGVLNSCVRGLAAPLIQVVGGGGGRPSAAAAAAAFWSHVRVSCRFEKEGACVHVCSYLTSERGAEGMDGPQKTY